MTALSRTPVFDAADTAALLDYPALLATLARTVADYAAGKIVSPERLVVPLQAGGVMLSMPSSAHDLAIHKLVNVCPGNAARGLPTILGQVIACDATTGEMRFVLVGRACAGGPASVHVSIVARAAARLICVKPAAPSSCVRFDRRAAFGEQFAQHAAVAAVFVVAIAADRERGRRRQRSEQVEHLRRIAMRHLGTEVTLERAPFGVAFGGLRLRDEFGARRQRRQPHVVIIARGEFGFRHAARRPTYRADPQPFARRARRSQLYDPYTHAFRVDLRTIP